MANHTYTLSEYVADLRTITAETQGDEAIVERVRPLARRLALNKAWADPRYYTCDEEQGFGVHLLHEEPDHTLAVFALAWLPNRGTPAHDHGTWAIVAGIDGDEENTFWKRLDDGSRPGYAELKHNGERVYGPGDVVSFCRARFIPFGTTLTRSHCHCTPTASTSISPDVPSSIPRSEPRHPLS